MDKKLSEKQLAFIREYLKDYNGTQAAIRAGYSKRTANEQAARALAKASIQEELAKQRSKIEKKAEISAEYVLTSLKSVADRCMEKKLDSSGANKALELLGKHLTLFSERLQLSGGVTMNLIDAIRGIPEGQEY